MNEQVERWRAEDGKGLLPASDQHPGIQPILSVWGMALESVTTGITLGPMSSLEWGREPKLLAQIRQGSTRFWSPQKVLKALGCTSVISTHPPLPSREDGPLGPQRVEVRVLVLHLNLYQRACLYRTRIPPHLKNFP